MAHVPRGLTLNYSQRSLSDLGEIWEWNAVHYGIDHAYGYIEFLRRETRKLVHAVKPGRPIGSASTLFYRLTRRRSHGHGHVVVFRIEGESLHVLRYFHTSQDWESQFDVN